MTSITETAYAKINLTLKIAARRPDGYHDIETLMVPAPLCDRLTLEKSDCVSLVCNDSSIPTGKGNLAYSAAELFFRETGLSGGAAVTLEKHIPAEAGLGGGSADAAAVLRGLDKLYGTRIGFDGLRALAARIGSDVPFMIESVPALCTGRGETVEPIDAKGAFGYAVIKRGKGASTAIMYLEADKEKRLPRSSRDAVKALEAHDMELLSRSIFNDFEPVLARLVPETVTAKAELISAGARAACLTGSGSAVFGLFPTQSEADQAICALM